MCFLCSYESHLVQHVLRGRFARQLHFAAAPSLSSDEAMGAEAQRLDPTGHGKSVKSQFFLIGKVWISQQTQMVILS